jgi:hypothetical protein
MVRKSVQADVVLPREGRRSAEIRTSTLRDSSNTCAGSSTSRLPTTSAGGRVVGRAPFGYNHTMIFGGTTRARRLFVSTLMLCAAGPNCTGKLAPIDEAGGERPLSSGGRGPAGGRPSGTGGRGGAPPHVNGGTSDFLTGGRGAVGGAQGGEGGAIPEVPSTGGTASHSNGGGGGSLTDDCFLERLGYGTQCVDALGIAEFDSVAECAAACLDDPECAGIGDYSAYVGLDFGCTTLKTCDPMKPVWTEEDGRFDYQKVCGEEASNAAVMEFPSVGVDVTPGDGCFYLALADYEVCDGALLAEEVVVGEDMTGGTLEECLSDCDKRQDCAAVQDWWFEEPAKFECVLHLGTCDASGSPEDAGDYVRTFRKQCP